MPHIRPVRVAQVAANKPNAATAYSFSGAAVSDVPAGVLASAQVTPVHARVKIINNTVLTGTGTPGDPMRPV